MVRGEFKIYILCADSWTPPSCRRLQSLMVDLKSATIRRFFRVELYRSECSWTCFPTPSPTEALIESLGPYPLGMRLSSQYGSHFTSLLPIDVTCWVDTSHLSTAGTERMPNRNANGIYYATLLLSCSGYHDMLVRFSAGNTVETLVEVMPDDINCQGCVLCLLKKTS